MVIYETVNEQPNINGAFRLSTINKGVSDMASTRNNRSR